MPGNLPGFLGIAAFGSIKFVGYSLAALNLRKFEPAITARPMIIAAARTGVGFVLGPPATILGALLSGAILGSRYNVSAGPAIYAFLFVARIFIWMLILFLFTRQIGMSRSKLWLYSVLGAVISSLLDIPGYALAIAAPGQITFC
jgi:hypothetical protein